MQPFKSRQHRRISLRSGSHRFAESPFTSDSPNGTALERASRRSYQIWNEDVHEDEKSDTHGSRKGEANEGRATDEVEENALHQQLPTGHVHEGQASRCLPHKSRRRRVKSQKISNENRNGDSHAASMTETELLLKENEQRREDIERRWGQYQILANSRNFEEERMSRQSSLRNSGEQKRPTRFQAGTASLRSEGDRAQGSENAVLERKRSSSDGDISDEDSTKPRTFSLYSPYGTFDIPRDVPDVENHLPRISKTLLSKIPTPPTSPSLLQPPPQSSQDCQQSSHTGLVLSSTDLRNIFPCSVGDEGLRVSGTSQANEHKTTGKNSTMEKSSIFKPAGIVRENMGHAEVVRGSAPISNPPSSAGSSSEGQKEHNKKASLDLSSIDLRSSLHPISCPLESRMRDRGGQERKVSNVHSQWHRIRVNLSSLRPIDSSIGGAGPIQENVRRRIQQQHEVKHTSQSNEAPSPSSSTSNSSHWVESALYRFKEADKAEGVKSEGICLSSSLPRSFSYGDVEYERGSRVVEKMNDYNGYAASERPFAGLKGGTEPSSPGVHSSPHCLATPLSLSLHPSPEDLERHNMVVHRPIAQPLMRRRHTICQSSLLSPGVEEDASGEENDLSLLDPYFDVSLARQRLIFENMRPSASGKVRIAKFIEGLAQIGISCSNPKTIVNLLEELKIGEKHGLVSFEEFDRLAIQIKLADLLSAQTTASFEHANAKIDSTLGVTDYSSTRIRQVECVTNLENFFFSSNPPWATVRWINLHGIDQLNLRRLAIRYRLHPLAVEDAMTIGGQRAKMDKYEGHVLLVIPLFSSMLRMAQEGNQEVQREPFDESRLVQDISGEAYRESIAETDQLLPAGKLHTRDYGSSLSSSVKSGLNREKPIGQSGQPFGSILPSRSGPLKFIVEDVSHQNVLWQRQGSFTEAVQSLLARTAAKITSRSESSKFWQAEKRKTLERAVYDTAHGQSDSSRDQDRHDSVDEAKRITKGDIERSLSHDEGEEDVCDEFSSLLPRTGAARASRRLTNAAVQDILGSSRGRQYSKQRKRKLSTRTKEQADKEQSNVRIFLSQLSLFIVEDHTVITMYTKKVKQPWRRIHHKLESSYSKVRQGSCHFLVYEILSEMVASTYNLVQLLSERILTLVDRYDRETPEERAAAISCMPEVRRLRRQLLYIRRHIFPVLDVVRKLSKTFRDDQNARIYLREVHDELIQMCEDMDQNINLCRQFTDRAYSAYELCTNAVLVRFILVMTAFLPAHFLTGVYGMNFEVLPELKLDFGYYAWWVGTAAIVQMVWVAMRWYV